jgi:uncharacterized membrane protein
MLEETHGRQESYGRRFTMQDLTGKTSLGLEPKVGGLLCYVVWWVTGIVFLVLERENRFVRFHAVQSIIAFGVVTVAEAILSIIPVIGWILGWIIWIIAIIIWIICMVKAYQGQAFKLPIAGDIAEKQAGITPVNK